MKFVLFCQNPYAFGILKPIQEELKQRGYDHLWFVTENIRSKFPFKSEPCTSSIQELKAYLPDAILCPGNEVPHYLRGLKVQIFHGLAGEKKGHFRIRHYFDLYLTQGPYFTRTFKKLKQKHKDFEVVETGWPKLDIYGNNRDRFESEKQEILAEYATEKIVLYAPTFSPSLTSAPFLTEEIQNLARNNKDLLVVVKFHDLMDTDVAARYAELAKQEKRILLEKEPNITKWLLMADLLVSDTSSVVYEFLLLNKPVITFKSSSNNIKWENAVSYTGLDDIVRTNLEQDPYKAQRKEIIDNYHPYQDGESASRMISAIEEHIGKHGVPEKRKLSWHRRLKIRKMFG